MIVTLDEIREAAIKSGPKRLVIPSVDKHALKTVSEAAALGLVYPVIIGRGKEMKDLIEETCDSIDFEFIDTGSNRDPLVAAIEMLKEDRADIMLRGAIDQTTFVAAILNDKNGLVNKEIASFISLFQLETKLAMVTDSYINNSPSLEEKRMIIENALELSSVLGIPSPRIAALTAIEQVNPNIPSTLDAAILSKMSERGQFRNAIIEGPIDIDCALSEKAAMRKGLKSPVTGNVDIYFVPDIEAGYSLSQLLVFIGKLPMTSALAGTSKPVVLNLPFVSEENRVTEIALASLMCNGRNEEN
ncbi:MAG: phosphate butyryltransferase [Deltaproteobacteria bacterium]|nr:phosphate butyryltransferase [Deltaproteobacteria bacterium]